MNKATWPKRIIVVRHGESEVNVKSPYDISLGDTANHDSALTELGKEQARQTGAYIRTTYGKIETTFQSTFRRTHETLSLMIPEAKPITDSRLNELWRGIWYTMPKEKIIEQFPDEEIIRAREGMYHYRAPGGQSCQDVELMIHSFIYGLRTDHTDKTVLISTHGNWMLLFWRVMLNRSLEEFAERYGQDKYKNCALSIYERSDEGMRLIEDNKIHY